MYLNVSLIILGVPTADMQPVFSICTLGELGHSSSHLILRDTDSFFPVVGEMSTLFIFVLYTSLHW